MFSNFLLPFTVTVHVSDSEEQGNIEELIFEHKCKIKVVEQYGKML